MKPIGEYLPTPHQLLEVGDAWDEMHPHARAAILMMTGFAWVGASGRWIEIPAQARLGITHGFFFFRDFLNRVLPEETGR